MNKRMIVALGVALVSVGQALAQAPAETLPAPSPSPEYAPAPVPPLIRSDIVSDSESGGRFWVTSDYLFSWMPGATLPPLVTTSPAGTARATAGVLGSPTTSVLFGGRVNDDLRSGFRLSTGYWFNPEEYLGVELGFTMLESQASDFTMSSTGTPILARPFTRSSDNTQQSVLVAFPGLANGGLAVKDTSGNYYDLNLDLTGKLLEEGGFRVDGLLGYRFFHYDEGLAFQQIMAPVGGSFVTGTQIANFDNFFAHNEFHGAELGAHVRFAWDAWSVELLGKFGVGYLQQEININGQQTVSVPGSAPVVQTGGVLALSSNIGNHSNNDWTVLPELGANLSWHVNSNVRVRLGYSILFLERLARADNQIDLTINPNLFPPSTTTSGASRPAFTPTRSDIWLQSLNLGMEFVF